MKEKQQQPFDSAVKTPETSKESQTRLAILDALPAPIALLDPTGVIVAVNEAWCRFAVANSLEDSGFGVGENYLKVCEHAKAENSQEAGTVAEGIRAVLRGAAKEFSLDYPCHSPSEKRWFRVIVTPLRQIQNEGAVVMHINITEQKLAEETLRASEANMAAAQRIAHFGSWALELVDSNHLNKNPLRWSDEVFRIFGIEPSKFGASYEAFISAVHPEDRTQMHEATRRVLSGKEGLNITHRIVRPDGTVRWVQELGELERDAAGRNIRLTGTVLDITERKQIEDDRDNLFNLSEDLLCVGTFEGHLVQVNPAWTKLLGWSAEELTNRPWLDFVHPEDVAATMHAGENLIQSQTIRDFENRYRCKDGSYRWLSWKSHPLMASRQVFAVARDITEKKQTAIALEKSEREQRQLAEQLEVERARLVAAQAVANMGSWETDLSTMNVVWSEQTHRIFETDPKSFAPTHEGFIQFVHPQDRAAVDAALKASIASCLPSKIEHRIVMPDGRIKFIEEHWQVTRNEKGQPPRAIGTCQDITARKRGELELEETQERYRALFDRSLDAVYVIDLRGRFIDANPAALELFGYCKDDIKDIAKLNISSLVTRREDAFRAYESMKNLLSGKGSDGIEEYQLKRKDGSLIWVELVASLVFEDGNPVAMQGIARDITERKRADRRLAAFAALGRRLGSASTAQEASRIIMETADELFGWDSCWVQIYTARCQVRTVLTIDLVDGQREDVSPPYIESKPSPMVQRVLKEGAQLILRDEISNGSVALIPFGDTARVSASIMIVPVRSGNETIAVMSVQSYTRNAYRAENLAELEALADYCGAALAQINAREARRQTEERFRLLAKATIDAIWDWDPVANKLWWSDGFKTLFGYDPNVIQPSFEVWTERLHPDDRESVRARINQFISEGTENFTNEYRFRRADGSYAFVMDRGHIIRDASGKPVRLVGGMTDLTERKKAEERLLEQAALLDIAHEAIQVRDLEDRIIYWNKGSEQTYGWTAAEAVGRQSTELFQQDKTKYEEALQILIETGEWSGEIIKHNKQNQPLNIEVGWTLVRDPMGKPKSIFAINTDVTERKKLEAQYFRAQRMESIGTLAGGIAHDLNNVLAPVMMSIEILKMKFPDPETEQVLNTLQNSAQRGADLVKQVLSFARGVEGKRVLVNPNHLMRELLLVLRDTFPKSIDVRFTSASNLWTVTGDATQLHQIFLNLCVNARDAMPAGGNLTVSLENVVLDETYAAMNPDSKPGAYVKVKVVDTGSGIPREIQDKVFEPFFTTKEIGKGTGLGLSTTMAIVKSHGGFINLYSEVGKGTKFEVYLPGNTTNVAAEKVAVDQTRLPRGNGEVVLVVDDEESIRSVTQKTLERFGYSVLLACNGAEAVSFYVQHQARIAVILTDMAMPIMDGPALIIALRSINSKVRIIGSSGLASHASVVKAVGAGIEDFVTKPYTAKELLNVLRKVLGEKSS